MNSITPKQCSILNCTYTTRKIRRELCDKHYMTWWQKERKPHRKVTPNHGLDTNSPEYRAWIEMKRRCKAENRVGYKNYGGRGIRVSPKWINNFPQFLKNVGLRPDSSYSLDRINNLKGYEPNNIRWATKIEQGNNRRGLNLVEALGEIHSIAEWSRITGLPESTIRNRQKRNWDNEACVSNLL